MDLEDYNLSTLNIKEWALNEDGARTLRIIKALARNHEKYGAAYCPCKIEHIPENICPCNDYTSTGNCHCGLYKNEKA